MLEPKDANSGRLLDLDAHDPALRGAYESRLRGHLEAKLSARPRLRYVFVGLAGLAAAVVCGSLAITEPATMPAAVRGLMTLFVFMGLGWTLLATAVLARGPEGFVARRSVSAMMAFGFTLVTLIALSVVSSLTGKSAAALPMLMTGLAMLICAAVVVIDARIERAESLIREQVLRVEARLAALGPSQATPRDQA
ncbi:hypothetical protein [Singulisphaera sp. PoT]|uniref:hypothetical protein n=1 Tax=Singulisphaera sp. PoT TaxID=3411797 RepID=UPI003BF4DE92